MAARYPSRTRPDLLWRVGGDAEIRDKAAHPGYFCPSPRKGVLIPNPRFFRRAGLTLVFGSNFPYFSPKFVGLARSG
jgi:hypothetical protein